MINIKTKAELDELVAGNESVVVKVGAEWCGPCRMLEQTLSQMEEKNPGTLFVKVDVDEADEIVEEYNIMSVPVTLYFKEGKFMIRLVGLQTEKQINETINSIKDEAINQEK